MDAEAACFAHLREFHQVRFAVGLGIKADTFIADADRKAVGFDEDCDIDMVGRLSFVGMLYDVGACFVNSHDELRNGRFREGCMGSILLYKRTNALQMGRRTWNG